MIENVTILMLLFFALLLFLKWIGKSALRNKLYNFGNLFLFSLVFNSLAFFISISIFFLSYNASARTVELLYKYSSFFLIIKFMLGFFAAFFGVVLLAGFYAPRISNLFIRVGIIVVQFVATVFLVVNYLTLETASSILGIASTIGAYAIGIFALFASFWNTYFMRKAVIQFVSENKTPRFFSILNKNQYALIFNDKFMEGEISDIINLSAGHGVSPFFNRPKNVVKVAMPFDLQDRVRTYADSHDIYADSLYIDEDENGKKQEELEERDLEETLAIGALRKAEHFIPTAFQKRLMLLESCDYDIISRKHSQKLSDLQYNFSRVLSGVYLVVSSFTTLESIELFKRLFDLNNLLKGFVLITDSDAWAKHRQAIEKIRSVQVVSILQADKTTLTDKIIELEIIAEKNSIGTRTALDWRIEQEILVQKLDQLEAFEAVENEGGKEKGDNDAEIENHIDAYVEKLGYGGEDQDIYSLESSRSLIPQSLADINLYPAKELIRTIANEHNYASRVYIAFNILEVLVKTLSIGALSSLPDNHQDHTEFPRSITGVQDKRGDIIDFADDINYLTKKCSERNTVATTNDSLYTYIHSFLENKVDIDMGTHFEALSVFFPYIRPQKIVTILDLLNFTSYMRNQIRGHGVVSNFMAAVSYGFLMEYLGEICAALNSLNMALSVNGDQSVRVNIMDIRLECGRYIRFFEDRNDFLYLEGIRKGKGLYIGYVSGARYRPSAILEPID